MDDFSTDHRHGSIMPPDLVTVRHALAIAFDPGQSFEIRALPSRACESAAATTSTRPFRLSVPG